MLIEFKVSNFLSFEKKQEFTMEAGKVRSFSERLYTRKNLKLLKFMAIYGANASGKSNLVSALEFAREIIVEGLPSNSTNCYCRISDHNREKTSLFEFTVEIAGKKYSYGFEVVLNESSFKSEWFHEIVSGGKTKTIFYRNIENGEFKVNEYFRDISVNERLQIYAEDIRLDDSVLFLTLMNTNKESLYASTDVISIYKTMFMWFKNKLSVNSPDKSITNFSFLLDNKSFDDISELLALFGTGVSEFKLTDIPIEKVINSLPKDLVKEISEHLVEQRKQLAEKSIEKNPAVMLRNPLENTIFILELNVNGDIQAKTIQFNHENTSAMFALNEESDGTVRLLDLVEVLLTAEEDQVYVIDEINRRFHPLLTYQFVEKYLELAVKRNIQLIVTTHESKLMDLNLLRKDEINFVNKDEYGRSEIYSLEKYGERFDKRICTAYLKGSYGAIPSFKAKG